MKNTLLGFLVASMMVTVLPVAMAKNGVDPSVRSGDVTKARADFEKEAAFYLTRVEDLRTLSVNESVRGGPVSRLRDQSLDGSPKASDLPEWFVRWHAASNGGANPGAKAAVAARDMFVLDRLAGKASGKGDLDRQGLNELLGRINSLNGWLGEDLSKDCNKITGCTVVGSPAVLGSSEFRSSVKRPLYNSDGGDAEGAGTGMFLRDAQ